MAEARPHPTWRQRLYRILEAGNPDEPIGMLVDRLMVILIVANVAAVTFETVESLHEEYRYAFHLFEVISVLIFTVEYLARLWVAPEHLPYSRMPAWRARLRYMGEPYAIIDILSFAPFWIALLFPGMDLRVLRVLRLLRLLKLARYSPALASLGRVIAQERRALGAAVFIMAVLLILGSTAMYHLERHAQPDKFASIPDAMWWSIAALTTVGFGDVVPITPAGKVIGGVIMVLGLGMFALPVGIIASGFASEIHRREFVVSWGMVARVPLFAKLDAVAVSRVAQLLRSRVAQPGSLITRAGMPADAMFFIAGGEVEVMVQPSPITLQEGDFFGEVGLLQHSVRTATVRAMTEVRLLVLEVDDFHRLMSEDDSLRKAVEAIAAERAASTAEMPAVEPA